MKWRIRYSFNGHVPNGLWTYGEKAWAAHRFRRPKSVLFETNHSHCSRSLTALRGNSNCTAYQSQTSIFRRVLFLFYVLFVFYCLLHSSLAFYLLYKPYALHQGLNIYIVPKVYLFLNSTRVSSIAFLIITQCLLILLNFSKKTVGLPLNLITCKQHFK